MPRKKAVKKPVRKLAKQPVQPGHSYGEQPQLQYKPGSLNNVAIAGGGSGGNLPRGMGQSTSIAQGSPPRPAAPLQPAASPTERIGEAYKQYWDTRNDCLALTSRLAGLTRGTREHADCTVALQEMLNTHLSAAMMYEATTSSVLS